MKISKLRIIGDVIGRVGMSELALRFVEECDGSYKGVMELCGKLSVVSKMATCDEYWLEQVRRGEERATWKVETL